MSQILLPAEFRDEHRQIVLAYLNERHTFTRHLWQQAVVAFDMLNNAGIISTSGFLPFPVIYRQQVEDRYADGYIHELYKGDQVEQQSVALWAKVASQIATDLTTAGLLDSQFPMTRYLLAYCLYW